MPGLIELLKHPLVLLLCAALITGLLLPWFARWREDRRTELTIKTELIGAMSECTMALMVSIEAFVARNNSPDPPWTITEQTMEAHAAMNTAFREFAVRSAVIGTKLEAYIEDGSLPLQWSAFREVVVNFYGCHGSEPEKFKPHLTRTLSELLRELKLNASIEGSWKETHSRVLEIKAALIRKVLAASFRLRMRP